MNDRKTISIDLSHTNSLIEALEAASRTYLNLNAHRARNGKRRVVASKITVECEVVDLSPDELALERAARATGYLDLPAFQSPEDVRQFFTVKAQELFYAEVSLDDETLARMADVVLKTRRNCDF